VVVAVVQANSKMVAQADSALAVAGRAVFRVPALVASVAALAAA